MARGDKPYRVYRGGRSKGRVPSFPKPGQPPPSRDGRAAAGRPPAQRRRRRIGWRRGIALGVTLALLAVVVWAVLGYLAFRSGVSDANARLDPAARAVLAPQDGLLLSTSTTILLLGTDHWDRAGRETSRRADSIILLRTDPRRGRLAYLSVPRDLRVDVPGHGTNKINAAFQLGGAALAARTVRQLTGIPIHHLAIVDFGQFRELVDAVGPITVDVPAPILSNKFDCPYATQERCAAWPGWRFERGPQTMDGRRALVYARIRHNRLNASESDLSRAARQQQVVQAVGGKLTSARTVARMPLIGDELVAPLATDLSAWQLVQLGWRRFRADGDRTLYCRLGGDPSTIGGQAFLIPTEENRNVIAMFAGAAAPQPPPPGTGVFGPGCGIGKQP